MYVFEKENNPQISYILRQHYWGEELAWLVVIEFALLVQIILFTKSSLINSMFFWPQKILVDYAPWVMFFVAACYIVGIAVSYSTLQVIVYKHQPTLQWRKRSQCGPKGQNRSWGIPLTSINQVDYKKPTSRWRKGGIVEIESSNNIAVRIYLQHDAYNVAAKIVELTGKETNIIRKETQTTWQITADAPKLNQRMHHQTA